LASTKGIRLSGAPPAAAKGDPLYVPYAVKGHKGLDMSKVQHCPDFNERMTLLDGKTKAVPYPEAGFNCNADYGLAQGAPPAAAKDTRYVPYAYAGHKGLDMSKVEHCPDFNERMTLLNGQTKAVPYPEAGWNCNADYGLAQGAPPAAAKGDPLYVPYAVKGHKGLDMSKVQHCPDFNERMTLLDGKTKAVPYPEAGFNCNADYGLAQGAPPAAAKDTRYVPYAYAGHKGLDMSKVEHCPDFNERMTLLNGQTKAVPYPEAGWNCNADYGLAQGAPPAAAKGDPTLYVPYATKGHKGLDLSKVEHCPDFNERMTLLNGQTKAVPYPEAGWNCNADYGLAQGAPAAAKGAKAGGDASLYVPYKYPGLKGFDISKL
jgi:hypothetical protein